MQISVILSEKSLLSLGVIVVGGLMSMGGDCRRGLMSPVVIDLGGDLSGVIVSGVNVPGVNVAKPQPQTKPSELKPPAFK